MWGQVPRTLARAAKAAVRASTRTFGGAFAVRSRGGAERREDVAKLRQSQGYTVVTLLPQRRIAPKETTVSQATAETITVGQLGVRFLVEGPDSNGSVSVFECYIPANARMPAPHSHDAFEETIYGLKGTTSWTVDGESIGIGVGEALCVPRGAVHGFQNDGGTDATFLAIASPGVFGPAYFREVGKVLAASAGGPPDVAALAEVMRRHGLTPAQPATT